MGLHGRGLWLFGGLEYFGFGLGLVGGLWGFWVLDELCNGFPTDNPKPNNEKRLNKIPYSDFTLPTFASATLTTKERVASI